MVLGEDPILICALSMLRMGKRLSKSRERRRESEELRQKQLNDFLLEVTKSLFQDMFNAHMVITKIMSFAQRLVDADRASLFLVDKKKGELYAKVFDFGDLRTESDVESSIALMQEIRFPISKGVAGYVARTGKVVNIKDAYKDSFFNPEIDNQTGYKTKTILCMPILIHGMVFGVVEMVNKRNGTFTKEDERAFEMFAVYCGLALYHSELYSIIRRSEQKYRVALDVLSYHRQSTAEELGELRQKPIPSNLPQITRYSFSPWSVADDEKVVYCLYMFQKLFSSVSYDIDDIMRFTLTVRKNYRKVPYHNFDHAFSVAQAMFVITETSKHFLTRVECITLFVACLCHDLDHRGKTNKFMVLSDSPLAAVYTTSPLEHHHFNQTVTILQNEGHNIFKYLTSQEYKIVLGDIKRFILATDLAMFFKNKANMEEIMSSGTFNWNTIHHRNTLVSLIMTACDLCSAYKPWSIHQKIVYTIMEEFWVQGDEEKMAGLTPLDLMNRSKKDQLPNLQVDFLKTICLPCYSLVHKVLPDTRPMLNGCLANLEQWQKLAVGGTDV